ncbi:MAG: DegT/DnrJ/EryC1/StrS family aminotransferase [Bryobacterales bacterium]|nr:DegT/DnrJ/EryC1/StrS family aminotransferase [Bryobacterales bacterium]
MPVPPVNLRPALEATREDWQRRLEEMFSKGQFILGDQVKAFESELAAAFSASDAVGVGNGTDAIQLCLREARLTERRQEVITSALTAPFSAIGILAAGCSVRFADVHPDTLQMDPDDAANRIRPRTAALMPVHLYGQPCAIDRFAKVAKASRLALVQDACQAHGARFQGKPFTEFSARVAYSFYPTKNLGCLGDGGAVVTNAAGVGKRLRELRDGGRRGGQVAYTPGINSRLDEMHACYLRAFLPKLGEWNDDRRRTAAFYDAALGDCPGLRPVKRTADSVCHLYVVRAGKRDRLREFLAGKGIGSGVHYPAPLHLHPAFRDCGLKRGDLPHAEKACKEIISLPLWPYLSESAAHEVASRVLEFYRF